ncbi:putative bifunctional diguanylate cyclase/phosphodiesterase [Geodermatophilus sabuli]|uniref:Diguanylate cyclase (GGDEF) domain-containing protein n=1 Tax=Geodermatophilus sabuli TaxID=1564158 RepID=A0A285EG80_9ACTN|nr:bifunctional diguanylate cyclase/phosphodiesterase [Geodermatophilus sabuli]MBB3083068.1 diguanylate cyclase (GGDEF)-like protein [Geodermatophilus sabuli]SNX98065.1 diguanylate cyclase (GGDEF) domain-containing protein [Geodermatophilus sabuli]
MTSTAAPSLWRRLRWLVVPPAELVQRTRWLFCAIAVCSLLLTTPAALAGAGPSRVLLVAVSGPVLLLSWVHRCRAEAAAPALDVVEVLALVAFTLACPAPVVGFGATFPAVWFRVMYGRTRHVVTYAAALSAALLGVTSVARALPGHFTAADPRFVLTAISVLLLSGLGARHLALVLFAREQTRARDEALFALGTSLLGVVDLMEIRLQGWAAVQEICRMTPGLRGMVVADEGAGRPLRVAAQTGGFARPLLDLPRALLPAGDVPNEIYGFAPPAVLTAAAGFTRQWVCMPLPASPARYMLLGAPDGVPADAVTAIQSLNNQVALAMRTTQAHRDLEVQARTDALTGLANRAAFTAALQAATGDAAGDTWVLFLDLDDFKVVNDGLGHAAGDRLLQHVATRVSGALRGQDLCARLGGDEFGVLLRGAGQHEAEQIGRRLVELLSAPLRLDGRPTQVGTSIGMAVLRPGISETEVVQQADTAMYAAKAAGKNRVQVFSPALLDGDQTTALETELRTAASRGEFVVHYQPIVATRDGRCTAVEALVRWAHPTHGLLGPDAFLDAAERTGVINRIGEQVLRQACAAAASWEDGGRPVALHVNASPSQLAHPRFVTVVRECLTEHALAPKQLIIEITESTVLDSPSVQATLDVLAGLGVGLAVDDFGTGYSALTTLRTLPVDIVKIDKSFVAGAATEVADQAVLEAIAQMAARLGLETVAEGVEDLDQQRFVERAGITAVQGYLHQHPVPAAELTAWLARAHTDQPVSSRA